LKNLSNKKSIILMTVSLSALWLISCGGPYSAKVVNQPTRKLEIADKLFENGDYDEAIVEYKDYLAVFAGDERSDFAQFRLAECYRLKEDYPLAAVEYRILISDYGYSEYVDDAFYLEALCYFLQSRRVERDQTKTFEARSRLTRFLRLFPNSPRREEALALLQDINDKLGFKKYRSAKLYYSLEHYNAARVYFQNTVDEYPDTKWAEKSRFYLGRIFEIKGEEGKAADYYRKVRSSKFEIDEKRAAERRLSTLTGNVKDE